MTLFKLLPAALATACLLLSGVTLTPEEQRGRQVYERGTAASGRPVTAALGADNAGIPSSILPCANCHGHDGRGKPESGVVPSDITWDALTKPYGVTHASSRTHPPYTERLFKRAVTLGIDPAGNSLDSAMPRFQIYNEDFSDLMAYIKRLGQNIDPGLMPDAVRLGVVLPPAGRLANLNQAVREALLQYYAQVNGRGGIFSRRVELSFTELPAGPAQASKALLEFIRNERIFALVAGYVNDAEAEIGTVLDETGTPSVAAFAAAPDTGSRVGRYAFYLDGGRQAEIEALAGFAERKFADRNVRVAVAADEHSQAAAQALIARVRKAGFVNAGGSTAEADIVFLLRPESGLPSAVADPRARVYMAVANGVLPASTGTQWWQSRAVAAAEIVAEGLKRSGRDVSRETLVESLEGAYRFETRIGAISFGPDRRIGQTGPEEVWLLDRQTQRFVKPDR